MHQRITVPIKLDPDNINNLLGQLSRAIASPETSVIVFDGNPDIFCLGMSFEDLINNLNSVNEAITLFKRLISTILFSPTPTIAVVQGKTLAGGVGIATACDYIIADVTAQFGFSETLFGLLPAIIFPAILQRISAQKAKNLFLSGNSISSTQAFNLGLIDEISCREDLEKHLQRQIKLYQRIQPEIVGKVKKWY